MAPGLRLELLETMNQPSATAPAACEPPAAADASAFAVLETLRELTVFRMRSEGPTVEKRVLADFPRPFRLSPIPETPFLRGTYVWPELRDLRAAGRNAELLERTAGFLHEAFRILREDGGMLRPDSLDALPHNAIRTSDGLRFFDINRSLDGGVPPSLYVFLLVLRDFGDFFVRAGLPPMPLRRTHARLCRTMGVLPQFARSVWLGSRVLWLSRPAAMSPRARYLVPLRAALTAAFVLAASALEPRGPSAP